MAHKSIKVKTVWLDKKGNQVGARVLFAGKEQDISIRELQSYRNDLANAELTSLGLKAKRGSRIIMQHLSGKKTKKPRITIKGHTYLPVLKVKKLGKQEPHKITIGIHTLTLLKDSSIKEPIGADNRRKATGEAEIYDIHANNTLGIVGRSTGRPVETYTLMHANDVVCKVYTELSLVDDVNDELLPFALTGRLLTSALFMEWLNRRIDNLTRTYMNKVYVARKVGRDREKILRDSCAISIVDNFWIKRSDVDTTWEELKRTRDTNLELVNTALTGEITDEIYKEAVEDTTSLFTIKGAFPKAVYSGCILKKGFNAEYEVAAFLLGEALGISVAKAEKRGMDDYVKCRIFTSDDVSLAHAQDLLHLTDYREKDDNDEHRALYDYFKNQGNLKFVRELERLFIFNYLIINVDLHQENFGFLYNSHSFELMNVAPCYDFNSAFLQLEDVKSYYKWILDNLPAFISNNPDIKDRLRSTRFECTLDSLKEINQVQKLCVKRRANYLLDL